MTQPALATRLFGVSDHHVSDERGVVRWSDASTRMADPRLRCLARADGPVHGTPGSGDDVRLSAHWLSE